MIPDSEVSRLLDELAVLLQEDVPDAEAIASWKASFDRSIGQAERGAAWTGLLARAHQLGRTLQERIRELEAKKMTLEGEMVNQSAGTRALKGYGSTLRG